MLCCSNIKIHTNINNLSLNIGFTIFQGSVVILRGVNGSGKSTLLRIIAGIQSYERGNVLYHNVPICKLKKPYANYIGHKIGIKSDLTVFDNIRMWATLYSSEIAMMSAIHYFGLESLLGIKCYKLSAGTCQRVALARLLACNSDLWLLDEVETALDISHRQLLYNIIRAKIHNGGIVIMSSHLDRWCNEAMEIDISDFYEKDIQSNQL